MTAPDVVGTQEAAAIFNVEVPRVTRYRKGGRMPPLAADLGATPVWHRADVEFVRDHPDAPLPDPNPLDLVSTKEVAAMFGVNRSQVGRWRRGGDFPAPCKQLAAGPLWWRSDVLSWTPPARRRTAAA